MEISRPFIRLPWAFDAQRMAEEVSGIDPTAWMQHPSRLTGNSAAALISRDGGDNDDFEGAMALTAHLRASPYLQQVLASFGEVLGRSRLMKLSAGSEVATHVDFNYHWYTRVRIHIPVVTNSGVTFSCGDRSLNMRAGDSWIFNSWRRHRVVNDSGDDRIHLVVDTSGSARFWQIVREMEAMSPEENEQLDDSKLQFVAYDPAARPAILTERFNIAPVMAPGEMDALVQDLVSDFESNPDNDPELVTRYKRLMFDMCKNWRELWHLYGYQRAGWPHYRRLLESVRRQLHPDRRALATSSNDLGVNPVIIQRILRPALAVDEFDHFVDPDKSS
ncbi:MAG: aspartyl/asparaginyl beta-hydroxylase domain-containing protein [Gammaproteobacteria bacterium]|nr:aspartyl/asparaginyl beta-hydroxylase domain-containing protein [Gammaproteobacteria bacterium]